MRLETQLSFHPFLPLLLPPLFLPPLLPPSISSSSPSTSRFFHFPLRGSAQAYPARRRPRLASYLTRARRHARRLRRQQRSRSRWTLAWERLPAAVTSPAGGPARRGGGGDLAVWEQACSAKGAVPPATLVGRAAPLGVRREVRDTKALDPAVALPVMSS